INGINLVTFKICFERFLFCALTENCFQVRLAGLQELFEFDIKRFNGSQTAPTSIVSIAFFAPVTDSSTLGHSLSAGRYDRVEQ
ncbi:hypothetical protein ABTE33_20670, partial [Acinetobacter baumannii]